MDKNGAKKESLLDRLLARQDAEFRATVEELVRKQGWPEDDPSFLIGIATGQIQVLLKEMPTAMDATFDKGLTKLSGKLTELQKWQTLQQTIINDAVTKLSTASDLFIEKLDTSTDTLVAEVKNAAQAVKDASSDIETQRERTVTSIKNFKDSHEKRSKRIEDKHQTLEKTIDALEVKMTGMMFAANRISMLGILGTVSVLGFCMGVAFLTGSSVYSMFQAHKITSAFFWELVRWGLGSGFIVSAFILGGIFVRKIGDYDWDKMGNLLVFIGIGLGLVLPLKTIGIIPLHWFGT
jgi:ABC-type multidrug transport system fused ATPase/permease subunit